MKTYFEPVQNSLDLLKGKVFLSGHQIVQNVNKKKMIRQIVLQIIIKEIRRKCKEKAGNKNAISHIIQAISMTVERGNATSIMGGTLGHLRKLEDFFTMRREIIIL